MVIISNTSVTGGILFTVLSGYTGTETFRWYVDEQLVGTDTSYMLINPIGGENVYVIMDTDVNSDWYDGHFYGGKFNGNFLGGTFHYGLLNGVEYVQEGKKPKNFTQ